MDTGIRSHDDAEYPPVKRVKISPALYRNVDLGVLIPYIRNLKQELREELDEISIMQRNLINIPSSWWQDMLHSASQKQDEWLHNRMMYHHNLVSSMLDIYLPPQLTNIIMTCFPDCNEVHYEGP